MKAEMNLMVSGKKAFPVILEEIRTAQHSIYMNVFIWRDDVIGNTVAGALLEAADRGVRVEIVKDRYGILCEYSEEDQSSFFHKDPGLLETAEIFCMKAFYQPDILLKRRSMGDGILLHRMQAHPLITIHAEEYRRDHSKFYIFDEKTIILGGINIEDKENGADRQGRSYLDYMVRIDSPEAVKELRSALRGESGSGEGLFGMNLPGRTDLFGIRRRYLDLIHASQKELSIIMAYIMPLEDMLDALEQALDRGVRVRMLIPEKANFLNASNRASVMRLFDYAARNGKSLEVYLSGLMTHIKAMISDSTITTGSANMTGKAFVQLGELNVFAPNDGSGFALSVLDSFRQIFEKAQHVTKRSQLKYSKIMLFLEKIFMSR